MQHFYLLPLFFSVCFRLSAQAQPDRQTLLPDSLNEYLPRVGKLEKLQSLKESLQAAYARRDTEEASEVYYLLGKLYQGAAQYKIARFWFLQSLRIREKQAPSENLVKVYIQLMGNYGSSSMFEQAHNYALLALKTARNIRSTDSTHALLSAYMVMAGQHAVKCLENVPVSALSIGILPIKEIKDHPELFCDSAFYYLKLAEAKAIALKAPNEIPAINSSLGSIYMYRGNLTKAIQYTQAALEGYSQFGHYRPMVSTKLTLAHLYLKSSNTQKAKQLLTEAQKAYIALKSEDLVLQYAINAGYAELYRQTNNYRKAFYYQQLAHKQSIKVLEDDRDGAVARLGVEYEAEKQSERIKSQEALLVINKEKLAVEQWVITGLIGGLVIAIGAGGAFFQLNRKNKRISQQNAALVREQNHRVKNNLQAVSNLLTLQSFKLTDENALRAITDSQLRIQSIELIHHQLYDDHNHLASVNLSKYIPELTKRILSAFGQTTVKTDFEIDELWLSADQMLSVGLILNEIITNACKYAFVDNPTPQLYVAAKQTKSSFTFIVQDNGKGIPIRSDSDKTYGLQLVQIQAQQLYGQYSLTGDNGTRFELRFPA